MTIPELLLQIAPIIRSVLLKDLPALSGNWWQECVFEKLAFHQQQPLDADANNQLERLDVAALIRVLDQNWLDLAESNEWTSEDRTVLTEMRTLCDRWAYAPAVTPSPGDVHRDLDTLQRLLTLLDPGTPLISAIAEAREGLPIWNARHPRDAVFAPPGGSMGQSLFSPGDIVHLRSDPSVTGAIIEVFPGRAEFRYTVFHDGKLVSFYESQLAVAPQPAPELEAIPLQEFQAHLTALHLLHPSCSSLYSLHAARIQLIPYQFRPVLRFIRADRPRFLIADSVGVGKTIEAGLILKELQARSDVRRVLVLCPRPLVTERKWQTELKRFDEDFEHLDGPRLRFCISETDLDGEWPDRYSKCILPFSLLTTELLNGDGRQKGLLNLDPSPQFDLVIVDEAHHIRNPATQTHQAVRHFCNNAGAALFLTATPIQLGEGDLFVLLNTLRPDLIIDEAAFASITEPNRHINEAALIARTGQAGWPEDARRALLRAGSTPWGKAVLQHEPGFQGVFDSLADAHLSRSARVDAIRSLEKLHTLSHLMCRTLRRDIGEFTRRKPETVKVPFTSEQARVHDAMLGTQARAYAALFGDRSVRFFLTTIRRQASSCINGLAPFLRGILSRSLDRLECMEISDQADDLTLNGGLLGELVEAVEETLRLAETLNTDPGLDPKFQEFRKVLDKKRTLPNQRVMVFSSFRHTLSYLDQSLKALGYRVGLVQGNTPDVQRVLLRTRFEMEKSDPKALDVLLFSEVGCEGLDYQFCDCMVNYDLPWNPMRIDQRIGRIDRWGQQSKAVAIYNLITSGTIDEEIYDRCLYRIGVFQQALGANEAILGKITRELTDVADNLSLSEEERRDRLEQLADNAVRLVREQQDLEAGQAELFGLEVPRDQFQEEVDQATSYWISPQAVENLIRVFLAGRLGIQDSVLSGKGPKKLLRLSRESRDALLSDIGKGETQFSRLGREWLSWLRGNNPNLSVTFDTSFASRDPETVLISPVHPLAQQASRAQALQSDRHFFTVAEVYSGEITPGDYPFAIYQWEYFGVRRDVQYRPITLSGPLAPRILDLLSRSDEVETLGEPVPCHIRNLLEDRHYEAWADSRAEHLAENHRLADRRLASLESSHAARMRVLDSQIEEARDEQIRKMREGERANAVADFERRRAALEESAAKADITAHPVGWGIIRVRA